MNKLVSVIIPAYNVQDYIQECVGSILNQTYKNIEILVYNDGSIDNTLKVLNKLSSGKVKVFTSFVNKGVAHARNYLFNEAQGEYIMLQDSDDKSLKNRISASLNYLENSDFIFTSCDIQTSNKNIFKYHFKDEFFTAVKQFMCLKPLGGASSFFDRCVIDSGIKYDESLLAGEDVLFDVMVQSKFPLKMRGLPDKVPYYWYRRLETSLTSIRKEKNLTPKNIMDRRNKKIKRLMNKVLLDNKELFELYFIKEPNMQQTEIQKLFKGE